MKQKLPTAVDQHAQQMLYSGRQGVQRQGGESEMRGAQSVSPQLCITFKVLQMEKERRSLLFMERRDRNIEEGWRRKEYRRVQQRMKEGDVKEKRFALKQDNNLQYSVKIPLTLLSTVLQTHKTVLKAFFTGVICFLSGHLKQHYATYHLNNSFKITLMPQCLVTE